jgi:hypothetical protein
MSVQVRNCQMLDKRESNGNERSARRLTDEFAEPAL